MAFTTKDWRDAPGDLSTPLSAAMLEDLETRVTDYADLVNGAERPGPRRARGRHAPTTPRDQRGDRRATVSGGDVSAAVLGRLRGDDRRRPGHLKSNVRLIGCGYAGRIKRIGTYPKNTAGMRLIRRDQKADNVTLRGVYIDGQCSVGDDRHRAAVGGAGGRSGPRSRSTGSRAPSPPPGRSRSTACR